MAAPIEVLVQFSELIVDEDGASYVARVLGAQTPLGHWEGWLEFSPTHLTATATTTDRETTQPNHGDLQYWAAGLSQVYLQGALRRARQRAAKIGVRTGIAGTSEAPLESPPATRARRRARNPRGSKTSSPTNAFVTAALDPFAVRAQGESILRQELGALSMDQLWTLVDAHELGRNAPEERNGLIDWIVATINRIVRSRPPR